MDFSSDSDVEPDLSRSWVTVDREAFALEDSMVAADSMFLVKREDKQSLVPGEKFVAKAHALMADNLRQDVYEDGTRGTLFLTNYRVLFATFEPSVSSGGKSQPDYIIDLPLCSIASVTEGTDTGSQLVHILEVATKDFQVVRFGFPYDCAQCPLFTHLRRCDPREAAQQALHPSVARAVVPPRPGYGVRDTTVGGSATRDAARHASVSAASAAAPAVVDNMWRAYDPRREYHRLLISLHRTATGAGVEGSSAGTNSSGGSGSVPAPEQQGTSLGNATAAAEAWRITHVNREYTLCATYPALFMVPASMSDDDLWRLRDFRAKGRVPATVYVHPNGGSISRCAQPLEGLRRKRCAQDVKYADALRAAPAAIGYGGAVECAPRRRPSLAALATIGAKARAARVAPRATQRPLFFVDCRNQPAAFANLAMGGGFESVANYKQSQVLFMSIENIHAMRESYRRLFELCRSAAINEGSYSHWLTQLDSTRWLEHICSLLSASVRCATAVAENGAALVCHCSDGWDRTSQVTSLAEILLDPFYRTIRGFQILVEKEWCSFGHRFAQRCGHADKEAMWSAGGTSPVFEQFLDVVWQLTEQFPAAFEFNSKFLVAIMEEMHACRSGTFLGNCELERRKMGVQQRAMTVWTVLRHRHATKMDAFVNPFYAPASVRATSAAAQAEALAKMAVAGAETSGLPRPALDGVLQPDCHPSAIKFWAERYLRYVRGMSHAPAPVHHAMKLRRECAELSVAKITLEHKLKLARQQLANANTSGLRMKEQMQFMRAEQQRLRTQLEHGNNRSLAHTKADRNDAGMSVLMEEEEDGEGVLLTHNAAGEIDQSRESGKGAGNSTSGDTRRIHVPRQAWNGRSLASALGESLAFVDLPLPRGGTQTQSHAAAGQSGNVPSLRSILSDYF